MRVVIATGNAHKLEEYGQLLPDFELESLAAFPPMAPVEEDAPDFIGNAIIKAQAAHRHTGAVCLADDSGIAVDALDGAPGVRSARWVSGSDRDRLDALLARMEGVENRRAHFVCAIAIAGLPLGLSLPAPLVWRSGCIIAVGEFHGRLGTTPRGQGGFGYDPIFELPDGRAVGELTADQKNRISHRALAAAQIRGLGPELKGITGKKST